MRKEEMMHAQRIEGAVALVTGVNRGIGRALTEALLARGVRKVYATARHPMALRDLRDQRLVVLRLDVTDPDQIRAAGDAASDVDIFPDPFAVDFGRRFESSPKASERQMAAMIAAMLSGSAA
jgi:NAD(P)-dependent dehydrogenase (short-subunit alcohol dehydrogenase family)